MPYILLGTIIWGIVWGIVVNKVVENKGYQENWFWWGFFFGAFALIIALTKPSANTTKVVIDGTPQVKENAMELVSHDTLNGKVDICSPIHITSWNIKKDSNENFVLYLEFLNTSKDIVSAVLFSVVGINSFGDVVVTNSKENFELISQDLNVMSGETGKMFSVLPNKDIRRVDIKVKKVSFSNGVIIENHTNNWIDTNQNMMSNKYLDWAKTINSKTKFYSIIDEDYWQCTCGFVNTINKCGVCGIDKMSIYAFTKENIYNEYLADLEKKEMAQKEQEEMLQRKLADDKREKERIANLRLNRIKRIMKISIPIIVSVVLIITLLNKIIIPNIIYHKALNAFNNQDYKTSIGLLQDINYKDSRIILSEYYKETRPLISAGGSQTIAIQNDLNVISTDLKHNYFENINDVMSLSVGDNHIVALKLDGTVMAVGNNSYGQSDVFGWKDIVDISAGPTYTLALRRNGTVVATEIEYEYLDNGQCNVSSWKDIVSISAGTSFSAGVKNDGSVVTTKGTCNWENIIDISVGKTQMVGLQSNGKVLVTEFNGSNKYDVSGWEDIVSVSAGGHHIVGLKMDGTVVACGNNDSNQCDVNQWTDIVAIATGERHTVGLKSDGTVLATGANNSNQCEVFNWTNIFPKQ